MKFEMGELVATPGALKALDEASPRKGLSAMALVAPYLIRHLSGDWGVVSPGDKKANDCAIDGEDRIMSAYVLADNTRIWIITEWDRSITTVLLPEEY